MSVKVFYARDAIPERSTYSYLVNMADRDGVAIEAAQIAGILATLRDVNSGTLIRDGEDVYGQNGGEVTTGRFELAFTEEDTQIIGASSAERRVLTLDFSLVGGGRVTREVSFYVRNFADIS
jgi:hypothetical protein